MGISQITSIAKQQAIKYASIGIKDIRPNGTNTGIIFTLSDDTTFTINLETMDLMVKSIYDSNDSGIVDNSEKLENKGLAYVLDRANHTGTQNSNSILVDKTNFNSNLKKYNGTNLQELFEFINTMHEFVQKKIIIGEEGIPNSFKFETQDSKLVLYRFQNGVWTEVTRFGSVESDRFILKDTASSIVFTSNDSKTYTLVKPSVDTKGVVLGNFLGRNVLMNNGELLSVSGNDPLIEKQRTVIDSDVYIISNSLSFERIAPESEAISYIKFNLDTPNVICRLVLRDEHNVVIARSSSDYDFDMNNGNISVIGVNTFTFLEPIALRKDESYKLEIQSKSNLNIKGDNSGSYFVPKYSIGVYPLLESTVITSNNINNTNIDYGNF